MHFVIQPKKGWQLVDFGELNEQPRIPINGRIEKYVEYYAHRRYRE